MKDFVKKHWKLILNVGIGALYVFYMTLAPESQEITWGAVLLALRAAIGFVAKSVGFLPTIPVDK